MSPPALEVRAREPAPAKTGDVTLAIEQLAPFVQFPVPASKVALSPVRKLPGERHVGVR
jgi:hypothetical protein